MITAKVIEDSISAEGKRLTTLQLCYPRFIHAEFMTHRVFSRNASSSRAIPVAKMLDMVRSDPAMPIHWGKNQPGMQAKEENTELVEVDMGGENFVGDARDAWRLAAGCAAAVAEGMSKAGYHKQVVNRLLEPFQHIHVIVTATEFGNFFALRDHHMAQPEIHELAVQMKKAMLESKPKMLRPGDWHMPYITQDERNDSAIDTDTLIKVSAARCARVSYLKHDGTLPSIADDLDLYGQLVVRPYTDKRGLTIGADEPIHASPVEHQATPDQLIPDPFVCDNTIWEHPDLHGNFVGWQQYRKVVELQYA